jgi:hypothetical protein
MGKTSPAVGINNTIGLPSGRRFSCPDQTDYCGSICYAGAIETQYAAVSNLLLHNWELLSGATLPEMVRLLSDAIAEFVAECDKRNARKLFRIHWDGDMFSGTYVAAWSRVIRAFPDVQFWCYTRVATAATFLHAQRHDNLALYYSADRDNLETARHLSSRGVKIAYVAQTFADGKAELPKAVRCPENNSRKRDDGTQSFPLITFAGSACARCGLCVFGRNDVLFSASKS